MRLSLFSPSAFARTQRGSAITLVAVSRRDLVASVAESRPPVAGIGAVGTRRPL